MKQKFFIDGEVFTAKIWKEDDVWKAECPELVTTAQGKSIKMARIHLRETSRMFLEKTGQK